MLSSEEKSFIRKHAYLPEHLIDYVVAVSQAEPFLFDDYICYYKNPHLIFIGYPIGKVFEKEEAEKVFMLLIDNFKPESVAFISPSYLIAKEKCFQELSDFYYRLDLSKFVLTSKLKNSINRALKEVYVENSKVITEEHLHLINEFLSFRQLDEYTQYIFSKIPDYVNLSETAQIFNARNKENKLIAFDIADYGSNNYAFYMFNFLSRKNYVPGVSDLLFYELIKTSKNEGKFYVNMGLGLTDGVVFFKKKWGGEYFLKYEFCFYKIKSMTEFSSFVDIFKNFFWRRN